MVKMGRPEKMKESNPSPAPPPPQEITVYIREPTTTKRMGRPRKVKEPNPSPAPQEIILPFTESTTRKRMGRPRKVKEPNPSPFPAPPQEIIVDLQKRTTKRMGRPRKVKEPYPSSSPSPAPAPPQEITVPFMESTITRKRGRPRKVREIIIEELEHCSHYNNAGSDNSFPHKKLRIVTFDPEHVSDIAARISDGSPNHEEVDSMIDSALVKVDEYIVKKETAPLLKSILAKQGNIAMNCAVKTTTIRSSLLENVCGLYLKLEKKDLKTVEVSEVKSMLAEVGDFEKVKLDVKWLRERLEDIAKTLEVSKDYYVMQEEVDKNNQDVGRKSKEVEELEAKTRVARDELATIEARGIKLGERLSDAKAKWASFCEKSLVEGLL